MSGAEYSSSANCMGKGPGAGTFARLKIREGGERKLEE